MPQRCRRGFSPATRSRGDPVGRATAAHVTRDILAAAKALAFASAGQDFRNLAAEQPR
jgi:hypothetical protein